METQLATTDLRGLDSAVLGLMEQIQEGRVFSRARQIWPDDRLLRKFTQRKAEKALHKPDVARELEALLTLTMRTFQCDPPWFVPYAFIPVPRETKLELREPLGTIRDPQLGRLGHWGLQRSWPDGVSRPIWFTAHAVERMASRLALDEPVIHRYCADAWEFLVLQDQNFQRLRDVTSVREVSLRGGQALLTIDLHTPRGVFALGRCPLEIAGERAIAKTFLEPWMPVGTEPRLTPEEAARRHEAFRSETIVLAHDVFKALALHGLAPERTQPVVDFLTRGIDALGGSSVRWVALLRVALKAADAAAPEARALLERAIEERDQAWNAWSDELRRIWSPPSLVHDVARARWVLAGYLERVAASAVPEVAGPLRDRAARERATALAAEPSLSADP